MQTGRRRGENKRKRKREQKKGTKTGKIGGKKSANATRFFDPEKTINIIPPGNI